MTAYEKKSYSLTVQFLRKLGVDQAVLKKSSQMGSLEKLIALGNFSEKLSTQKGLMLMLEYEREMKEAEKLKTAIDLQKDKEKKAEVERKKQIQIVKQKEKQRKVDIENREREKKERYNNSDYVHITSTIKENFNLWLKKGEFEKTVDFHNRISNNSFNAFDNICYNNLTLAFNAKSRFSSNLLEYNPDTEKFGIEFTLNDVLFYDSINIPIKEAPKFKAEVGMFGIYVDEKDWGFIDNYLTPTKITFFNNNTKAIFEFIFASKDLKSISFSTTELGINLSNVNIKFNFDEFCYNRMFEDKDGSAINNLAWECLLNQNFSKALQILERAIPLIDDKDKMYQYLLINLAHAYLFNNQFDKAHKIYFENLNLNLNLNGKTWKGAILEDFNDFKRRGIESTDIEKIKQELIGLKELVSVSPEKIIPVENSNKKEDPDKVFTKVEIEASFPGGPESWTKYINKAIKAEIKDFTESDYGTCIVRFIVDRSGNVSDVQATTMKGSKIAEVAIYAIRRGPKWTPAQQNGRFVNAYRLQPVTLTNPKQ